MMLDSNQMDKIVMSVVRGEKPPKSLTPEEAQFWKDVSRDIANMPKGTTVHIPSDSCVPVKK